MMLGAGLWQNLSDLVSETGIVTVVLLLVGCMLIIIEFYQPAYGIPTYCGAALCVGGIAVRMIAGGSFTMMYFAVLGCVVCITAAHVIMLRLHKRTWLTQSLALKLENAVRLEDDDDGYTDLVGHSGVATTDIDGNGHMLLGDVYFYVTSASFIPKGASVRVSAATEDRIEVEIMPDTHN